MVRQAATWVVMGAFVLGLAAPALAQGTAAPATTPAAPAAKPAGTPPAKPTAVAKTKTVSGVVKTVAADNVVVTVKGKDMTFTVGSDTVFKKAGKKVEAKDLAEKDSVTVQYADKDGKATATAVTIKPKKS